MKEPSTQLLLFKTEDDRITVDVRFDEETAWLTLDQMAMMFERDKSTISRHIKNVFDEGELDRNSVVANFATTAADGKTYQVDYLAPSQGKGAESRDESVADQRQLAGCAAGAGGPVCAQRSGG